MIEQLKNKFKKINSINKEIEDVKERFHIIYSYFVMRLVLFTTIAGAIGVTTSVLSGNDLHGYGFFFTLSFILLTFFGVLLCHRPKDKQFEKQINLFKNNSHDIKVEISLLLENLEVQKQVFSLLYNKNFDQEEMRNFQLAIAKKDYLLATEYLEIFIEKIIIDEGNEQTIIEENLLIKDLHRQLGLKNINNYDYKENCKEKVMNAL